MKSSEINHIKSDSLEINCQGIYDAIIAYQREFDGNLLFEKNISKTLNEMGIEVKVVEDKMVKLYEILDKMYGFN